MAHVQPDPLYVDANSLLAEIVAQLLVDPEIDHLIDTNPHTGWPIHRLVRNGLEATVQALRSAPPGALSIVIRFKPERAPESAELEQIAAAFNAFPRNHSPELVVQLIATRLAGGLTG